MRCGREIDYFAESKCAGRDYEFLWIGLIDRSIDPVHRARLSASEQASNPARFSGATYEGLNARSKPSAAETGNSQRRRYERDTDSHHHPPTIIALLTLIKRAG